MRPSDSLMILQIRNSNYSSLRSIPIWSKAYLICTIVAYSSLLLRDWIDLRRSSLLTYNISASVRNNPSVSSSLHTVYYSITVQNFYIMSYILVCFVKSNTYFSFWSPSTRYRARRNEFSGFLIKKGSYWSSTCISWMENIAF